MEIKHHTLQFKFVLQLYKTIERFLHTNDIFPYLVRTEWFMKVLVVTEIPPYA